MKTLIQTSFTPQSLKQHHHNTVEYKTARGDALNKA